MAENTHATHVEKEERDKKLFDSLDVARKRKSEMIEKIEKINLSVENFEDLKVDDKKTLRTNIDLIFKINAGMNAALNSGDKKVSLTVSSSTNIQNVVGTLSKVSGVMEYFLTQVAYLTKKGDTEEAIKIVNEQALVQGRINDAINSLEVAIKECFMKGYGNRFDIEDFLKEQRSQDLKGVNDAAKDGQTPSFIHAQFPKVSLDEIIQVCKPYSVEKAKKLYAEGKKPSIIAQEVELPLNMISSVTGELRKAYLTANQKEIEKAFAKEPDIKKLSEQFEVNSKKMKEFLQELALTNTKIDEALKLTTQKSAPSEDQSTVQSH